MSYVLLFWLCFYSLRLLLFSILWATKNILNERRYRRHFHPCHYHTDLDYHRRSTPRKYDLSFIFFFIGDALKREMLILEWY